MFTYIYLTYDFMLYVKKLFFGFFFCISYRIYKFFELKKNLKCLSLSLYIHLSIPKGIEPINY